ncbi:cupin domain-containing protein [Sinorhizobium fredii]|uniref:Cupin domain-containing protein n=1 Tax=Rhizobium fredii TaxID=380 RepID=A0A2L0H7Q2_RHIFR|nr:cupin domain-containing protein [Sinorhizobium fredii]
MQDTAKESRVNTGVFEATPGETHSIKGETFEFCHLVHGVIELTEKGKEPVIYRAGDSFVMKPGDVGVWKTIETVRKISSQSPDHSRERCRFEVHCLLVSREWSEPAGKPFRSAPSPN